MPVGLLCPALYHPDSNEFLRIPMYARIILDSHRTPLNAFCTRICGAPTDDSCRSPKASYRILFYSMCCQGFLFLSYGLLCIPTAACGFLWDSYGWFLQAHEAIGLLVRIPLESLSNPVGLLKDSFGLLKTSCGFWEFLKTSIWVLLIAFGCYRILIDCYEFLRFPLFSSEFLRIPIDYHGVVRNAFGSVEVSVLS